MTERWIIPGKWRPSLPLKVDNELEISLKLDGNGEELNTFLVKEETPGSKETAVEIDFNDLPEETLSDDKEFTG